MNSCTLASPRIVVLAAGFSTRLGSSKALARVRGRSLLDRTLEVLAPFATRSIVVVIPPGAGRYRIGRRVHRPTFVVNSRRAQGLSSSVCRAITYARYSCAVLLLPVDLVELERRDIAKLISRWRGAGGPGGGGRPAPPCGGAQPTQPSRDASHFAALALPPGARHQRRSRTARPRPNVAESARAAGQYAVGRR
jgi:CTP:molybdopterin cytidylyltransferase MocA